MKFARLRIARPTVDPAAALAFYVTGLGMHRTDGFHDHEGYSGDIISFGGGSEIEIELVHGPAMVHAPTPTPEDALVIYFNAKSEQEAGAARLEQLGHQPVLTENPYWRGHATAFRDPDGYLVILVKPEASIRSSGARVRP